MCGIVATIPENPEAVEQSLISMHMRGPDQKQSINVGFASIGVTRLSITDLERGDQPLFSPSGQSVVVFNGAIYNLHELRDRFELDSSSGNDGEVIHQLYEKVGIDFAGHFDGMFAIVIADLKEKKIVVAVDSIGIKPLYICEVEDTFFVASIPQAFPKKYAKMIRRVPPGTVWTSDGQSKRFFCHATRDGILDDLLSESVRRQIPKEVSWGCLLSGGVDSSTIAALACREYGKINTFTSGLAGSEDLIAASKVAEHLGTNHHEEIINPTELPKLLKDVIGVSGSPDPYVAMSGLGTYVAARGAARFGAKVLLSGEGADELFAGYDEYLSEPEYSLNARLTHDQNDLGATECLRLDRCTMAYSIEARVPFLSPSMVRHARTIPIQWKLCHHNGNIIRKPVLRRFAKRLLPKWVADRPKNPFFRGAGIFSSLSSIANDLFSMKKVKCMKSEFPEFPIEDPISAWVFSIWYEQYAYLSDNINDLINRGLFRRRFSQYQPHCEEPTQYSSPMYSERFKY